MTDSISEPRAFRVRVRHDPTRHGRVVMEATFEAAAVAFVEHLSTQPEGAEAIGVVVHDVQTGREHSFSVQLGSGDAVASP